MSNTFHEKYMRVIPQIDFVPTFSLLLGIPIPFGNLGSLIPELLLSFKPGSSFFFSFLFFPIFEPNSHLKSIFTI